MNLKPVIRFSYWILHVSGYSTREKYLHVETERKIEREKVPTEPWH